MNWLPEMDFWYWWILAGGLLILELLIGTEAFLLAIALAAALTGILAFVFPALANEIIWLAFAFLAVDAAGLWYIWRRRRPQTDAQRSTLNRRGHQYIGRRLTLSEAIVNGTGKVRVDDSNWKVRGPDLPEGTEVTVIDADGAVLVVEKSDIQHSGEQSSN